MNAWRRLRLSSRFTIIVGLGVIALVFSVVLGIAAFERAEMERQLKALSVNEMTSLHAFILNVMAKRPEDGDNIGIKLFNNWFDSRNADYPGQVWSAWSPQVTGYMAQAEPDRPPKRPRDDIDAEAFRTGQPVGRVVGGSYRYAYPIVLGVTAGTDQEVCYGCHGAMGLQKGDVIAVLSSSLSTAEAEAKLHGILAWLIGGGVLATLLAVLGAHSALRRLIARPVGEMTRRMGALAGGDTAVEIDGLERQDEIGDIARAVQVFKQNSLAKRAMEAEAEAAAAAREARMARLERLIGGFESSVAAVLGSVGAHLGQLVDTAGRMVTLADSAVGRADSAAQHARAVNQNVRLVADAADELRAVAHEIAQQVGKSSAVAASAGREAGTADDRVRSLADAAEKIGAVVALITGIAEQTNLLALNATIESARAGEFGKGFAVVAGEVKSLARQTVTATADISGQISGIQDETGRTVEAIRAINATIAAMEDIAAAVAAAIEQEGTATREIARNIEHAAAGTDEVYADISEVTAAIGETDKAARQVMTAVEAMKRESETLRGEVDRFLAGIRQA